MIDTPLNMHSQVETRRVPFATADYDSNFQVSSALLSVINGGHVPVMTWRNGHEHFKIF